VARKEGFRRLWLVAGGFTAAWIGLIVSLLWTQSPTALIWVYAIGPIALVWSAIWVAAGFSDPKD
jgi:hypothetical protein